MKNGQVCRDRADGRRIKGIPESRGSVRKVMEAGTPWDAVGTLVGRDGVIQADCGSKVGKVG